MLLLFIGGLFITSSMGFFEPILCPSGMRLGLLKESISDSGGNGTGSYPVCTDGQELVDITGKMLIILLGVAISGVGLLETWVMISPSKEVDVPEIRFG